MMCGEGKGKGQRVTVEARGGFTLRETIGRGGGSKEDLDAGVVGLLGGMVKRVGVKCANSGRLGRPGSED